MFQRKEDSSTPKYLRIKDVLVTSGVTRAFLGGRLAHPEGQNEEENK